MPPRRNILEGWRNPDHGYVPQADRSRFYFWDDFDGGNWDQRWWRTGGGPGYSFFTMDTITTGIAGVLRGIVSSTATRTSYIDQNTVKGFSLNSAADIARLDLTWRVQLVLVTYLSFTMSFYIDATHFVDIQLDTAVGVNWLIRSYNGASNTTTNTGVAPAAATWYKLRITGLKDGSGFDFFADGVLLGTITTNIPTGEAGIQILVTRRTGGTGTRTWYMDWVQATGARVA
jgi:hypothetical protein